MDEPWNHAGNGTPTVCEVHQSKLYSLVMLGFILGLAAVCVRVFPPFQAVPGRVVHSVTEFSMNRFMALTFALLISICAAALAYSLVTRKLMVRVDELGIHYPRGMIPLIDWADVISVDRALRAQRSGRETQYYLWDGWRPIRITVRNPDKYLFRFQKWARANFASLVPDADRTVVQIEFMGLTPGSDVVETCIRRHLAGLGTHPNF